MNYLLLALIIFLAAVLMAAFILVVGFFKTKNHQKWLKLLEAISFFIIAYVAYALYVKNIGSIF